MGNGFPIGGVLIAPHFEARPGLLGTTFGGNHLACAAAIAVLDVMERDGLVENAATVGEYLLGELHKIGGLKEAAPAPRPCGCCRHCASRANMQTGSSTHSMRRSAGNE